MTKIDSGSQPPLSRRTSSSIITITPAPMSVAIAKVPPATSGHMTSITLMPVSQKFRQFGGAGCRADELPYHLLELRGVEGCARVVSGVQHGAAAGKRVDRRIRDAADDASAAALYHLHVDSAPVGFVTYCKLRQDVGHGGRIEQRIDHTAARLNETADSVKRTRRS